MNISTSLDIEDRKIILDVIGIPAGIMAVSVTADLYSATRPATLLATGYPLKKDGTPSLNMVRGRHVRGNTLPSDIIETLHEGLVFAASDLLAHAQRLLQGVRETSA